VVEDVAECGTVVEDGAECGNRTTVNIIVIVQGYVELCTRLIREIQLRVWRVVCLI